MVLTAQRHTADDPALALILTLIRDSFAEMDGRIDPPSSAHRLTADALRQQTGTGEIWSLGLPPVACALLTPKPGVLYVGKLAVARAARGRGHARRLIALAVARAHALNLPALELETRIELTGNHAAFTALGFAEVSRSAHPGYGRPTSITMRRPVAPSQD